MVAAVEDDLGPIDILVNNAGINLGKERHPIHEFLDDDWHRILRVDLDGLFYCSRAVSAPHGETPTRETSSTSVRRSGWSRCASNRPSRRPKPG